MRRAVLLSIVIACMFPMFGCPRTDELYYYYGEQVKRMTRRKDKPDLRFQCKAEDVEKMIRHIRPDFRIRSLLSGTNAGRDEFETIGIVLDDDIMLVGIQSKEKDVWDHTFIIRNIGEHKSELYFDRVYYESRYIRENPKSAYFFDWKTAIVDECARQGIQVFVK